MEKQPANKIGENITAVKHAARFPNPVLEIPNSAINKYTAVGKIAKVFFQENNEKFIITYEFDKKA